MGGGWGGGEKELGPGAAGPPPYGPALNPVCAGVSVDPFQKGKDGGGIVGGLIEGG